RERRGCGLVQPRHRQGYRGVEAILRDRGDVHVERPACDGACDQPVDGQIEVRLWTERIGNELEQRPGAVADVERSVRPGRLAEDLRRRELVEDGARRLIKRVQDAAAVARVRGADEEYLAGHRHSGKDESGRMKDTPGLARKGR